MTVNSTNSVSSSIVAIQDAATGRDLPGSPEPYLVRLDGAAVTTVIRVIAGSHPSVQVALTSDREWLIPSLRELVLATGQAVDVVLTITGTGSEGGGDFGVLEVAWNEGQEAFREHVLVQRQCVASASPAAIAVQPAQSSPPTQTAPESTPQPQPQPQPKKSEGVSTRPSWMEGL